ncbi:MFS transporter [Oenococcus oeni]|uniref:MFS transporter n=1 Tax=Oenococcus oeni TaxID=1247 RepID=UPI0010BC8567|nr:MFS transporter [Oenococcus oeni]SYW21132.1 MDR permease [Oenococcus oeni]
MNKIKYFLPVLLLGNLLCMMDVSIMTIILPKLQTAFNESLTNLSWVINVYTILFATLIIPFGRLAERFGRNKFVFCGLFIFGLGSLLTGLSTNLVFMLFARAIQSIGTASIIPTSMVIGLENSDQSNRNKIVAALAGIQGLAVALGPAVGGVVSQYWGWRWVFFINVPLVILDLLLFAFVLPLNHEATSKTKIDWLGALLSMSMLFSLSLGLIEGNSWGWSSLSIIALFIVSLISLTAFIILEYRQNNPMINMDLFKSRNFNGASISLILCNYFLGGMAVLIPTFLTRVRGESELKAALLITPYSLAVMISVISTSLLIKKINNKLLVAVGFVLIEISYYLLANLNVSSNYNELIIADITLGVGYGMIAATANILAVADFHGNLLTASQSVANVLRQVGMILSIAIFTTVLTSNVYLAKNSTLKFAYEKTQKLSLSSNSRAKLKHKIYQHLNPKSSNFSKTKETVKLSKVRVSNVTENKLFQDAYQKQLKQLARQKGIQLALIPQTARIKLKVLIHQLIRQKIRQKEKRLNQQLTVLVKGLKKHLKNQLNKAFLHVYGSMLWLPFVALLSIPIFKFKK